ncbi:hypothetical protein B0H14DRAFT_3436352 [Mycena olivaceomarginata]|nr:hypothetical protein B0H14DRAFT_3436352 [Mycena olivaceomarginata]
MGDHSPHQAPCDDLPGTVSQCNKNLEMCADTDYGAVLTTAQEKHFMWRIIQRQAACAAAGTAFECHVPACTRRISSLASTAFTILYTLEHLNTNTAWTEKSELTINMIIASPLDFFEKGYMYEAILHHAPKVKKVTFYFFLPEVPGTVSQG